MISIAAVPAKPENLLRRLRQRHPNKITAGVAAGIYAVISHSLLQGEGPVRVRVDLTPLLQSPMCCRPMWPAPHFPSPSAAFCWRG